MSDIRIKKINEVFVHIDANRGILMEISERFRFQVPGYKYMPKYRAGIWDGTVRLFDIKTQRLHIGLLSELADFANEEQYDVAVDGAAPVTRRKVSREDVERFIDVLKIPEKIVPRDYQVKAVHEALVERRAGFLSPTSSGKSLIIYMITQFFLKQGKEALIIVPTTQLVSQMDSDFAEYNNGVRLDSHCIMGGVDKKVERPLTISTWQSIYKMDAKWFARYDVVIGDEAHLYKAASLVSILEKCVNTADRFAFTGTLDGSSVNKMQIEALFGRFRRVTTTEALMKAGHVSELDIKALVLKYPVEEAKLARANKDYNDEINFINSHAKRNDFIVKLVKNLEGNTLVLFKRVETHGKVLFKLLKEACGDDAEVYFISGATATEDREFIRKLIDNNKTGKRIVIVGSSGTMSTGTNMKKLYHLVFVSPGKSRITVLQSVGRGLRLDGVTNKVTLWDIVDDMRVGTYVNHTLRHFGERVKMYDSEKFNYKIVNYEL